MSEKSPDTEHEDKLSADTDRYYYYQTLITENIRNGYDFMVLKYCRLSIPLIPSLIEREIAVTGEFEIRTMPAIELGAKLWSRAGEEDKVLELKALVESYPELESWNIHIERAISYLKELKQEG